ncbi:MAG: STAS domain-containing protein [Bacteroidota bacterium]
MKYSIDKQDKYAVFSLQDENLNSTIAPDLKSEFLMMRNSGVPNLILNLEAVKFVDSSGLSAILTGNRLWQDGSFVLTGVNSESVQKLITISKLDSILKIIPTLSESVDYIFLEEVERELNGEADSDD